MIMLQNALYEIFCNNHKTVCFVTCNEVLAAQLKREITAILPKHADKFTFCSTENPKSIQVKDVMIVDEADMCLEKVLTLSEDYGDLNGMFMLKRAFKCYFFSATMSEYYKELVSQVIGSYTALEFKSQYQLSNNSPLPYQIEAHMYMKHLYVEKVCDYIRSRRGKADIKPMMIFVEKPDNALTTRLEEAVRHTFGNRMFVIRTGGDLLA